MRVCLQARELAVWITLALLPSPRAKRTAEELFSWSAKSSLSPWEEVPGSVTFSWKEAHAGDG
jgi:hypothetical protein